MDCQWQDFAARGPAQVKLDKEKDGFPVTALREVNILLSFHHANIVDVKEVVVGNSLTSVYMVMEYMEHDLKALDGVHEAALQRRRGAFPDRMLSATAKHVHPLVHHLDCAECSCWQILTERLRTVMRLESSSSPLTQIQFRPCTSCCMP